MIRFKVVLDKRTPKANQKFPLKLRITNYSDVRFISLHADYTEKEFNAILNNIGDARWTSHREAVIHIQEKAERISNRLIPFDYNRFKGLLFQTEQEEKPRTTFISDLFDERVKYHESKDAIRTAISYNTAKNHINKFREHLRVEDVNEKFLMDYEKWFLSRNDGRLTATLGIYLRYLRAIVNIAIAKGMTPEKYSSPFNKHIYSIPLVRRAKQTLSSKEIEILVSMDDFKSEEERLARDIWVFQFRCNGVNLKDLLLLRWDQRMNGYFVLIREKTKNSTRGNPHPIRIPITPKLDEMLNQLGRKDSPYVLGYMKEGMSERIILDRRSKIAKSLNIHLKNIGVRLNLSVPLLTKTARDCYATYLKNQGVRIEVISESMGHTSINTTRHYLDAFDPTELLKANCLLP